MLASNALPSGVLKTAGKLAIKFGKGAKGVVHFIPHIDEVTQGAYKTYQYVKNSETFVEVTDNLNKGTKYLYKFVDNGFKLVDNIVGVIAKKISQLAPEITEATRKILSDTKPTDLKGINAKDFGNAKGALGERVAKKTANIVKDDLAKEGATFFRPATNADLTTVNKNPQAYTIKFNDKEQVLIKVVGGADIGDLDDFYKVNDKWVVTEVKTKSATNIDGDILDGLDSDVIKRLNVIKEITGETPEFMFMIPQGEAVASKELSNFLSKIRNAGYRADFAELQATNDAFNKATEEINKIARAGG